MPNWHCTDLYGKDLHEEEGLPQGISFFYLQQKRFFVKFWGAKVSMHSWRGHALNTVRVLFRCVC